MVASPASLVHVALGTVCVLCCTVIVEEIGDVTSGVGEELKSYFCIEPNRRGNDKSSLISLNHTFLVVATVGVEVILFTDFRSNITFPLWLFLAEN